MKRARVNGIGVGERVVTDFSQDCRVDFCDCEEDEKTFYMPDVFLFIYFFSRASLRVTFLNRGGC